MTSLLLLLPLLFVALPQLDAKPNSMVGGWNGGGRTKHVEILPDYYPSQGQGWTGGRGGSTQQQSYNQGVGGGGWSQSYNPGGIADWGQGHSTVGGVGGSWNQGRSPVQPPPMPQSSFWPPTSNVQVFLAN